MRTCNDEKVPTKSELQQLAAFADEQLRAAVKLRCLTTQSFSADSSEAEKACNMLVAAHDYYFTLFDLATEQGWTAGEKIEWFSAH